MTPSPRAAVTAVFWLNGAAFSSWYARLPAIQDDLGLGPGALGAALLGAPAGLLLAQPLVGAVVARVGSRPVVAAAPLWLAAVVLPALAVDAFTLGLAALCVGAANGALDIAMNAQGLAVERASPKRIFNSLHAAFSFGALAGAAVAGVAAGAGVAPLPHLAAVAVAAALVGLVAARGLLPREADASPEGPRFARPSRRLAALGAIAFCALLAEGAVFDWSAVYLATETGAASGLSAAGLAAFSATMGVGRLASDRLAAGAGPVRVGRLGALVAALGLGSALAFAVPGWGILGFALMGLGLSAVFPLALRAGGQGLEGPGPGLAAVSTVGYAGFLCGPPVIGLLAQVSSLRAALLLAVLLCLVAAALAGHVRDRAPAGAQAGLASTSRRAR
jgi:MFS family permease